jgi:hypothetical protein
MVRSISINVQFDLWSAIDHKLSRPLSGEPNLEQQENDLNKAIQNALPELQVHYNWLYNLTTEEYQNYVVSGQESPIVTQFEQLNSQLGELRTQTAQVISQVYQEVEDLNKSEPTDNQYVSLEKEMNAYVLKSLKYERDSFTEKDWNFIHEVSKRCPQDWGDGVLKARGLWLKYGGAFELAWQECFPTHENKLNSEGRNALGDTEFKLNKLNTPEGMTVYPVPVTDELKLYVPTEYINSKYDIITLNGVVLLSGKIETETQNFNVANLGNGIYFIQISAFNKLPITLKFVVQKL